MAETLIIYAGIPLALILVVTLLTVARSSGRPPRYKPGTPWEYEDVWYEPHPEPGAHGGSGHAGELITGHGDSAHQGGTLHGGGEHVQPGALASALAIGETPHGEHGSTALSSGGSSAPGSRSTGGATAIGAGGTGTLPRRTAAGGARGTW